MKCFGHFSLTLYGTTYSTVLKMNKHKLKTGQNKHKEKIYSCSSFLGFLAALLLLAIRNHLDHYLASLIFKDVQDFFRYCTLIQ